MKNKQKMMIVNIVLGAILLVLLSGYGISLIIDMTKSDAVRFKQEYEKVNPKNDEEGVLINISSKNPIKYVNVKKAIDIFKNGTGIVYMGFKECPWCRNIIPALFESAKLNKIDTIYYLDTTTISNTKERQELMQILDEYLKADENGTKKIYVPDVYFVKNGKIVDHYLGSVKIQENPFVKLTEEQSKQLQAVYNDMIKKMEDK